MISITASVFFNKAEANSTYEMHPPCIVHGMVLQTAASLSGVEPESTFMWNEFGVESLFWTPHFRTARSRSVEICPETNSAEELARRSSSEIL